MPEGPEVAKAREDGEASAGDEHVDGDDRDRDDEGERERAAQLPPYARTGGGTEHAAQQREQRERVREHERGAADRKRPRRPHASARGVQGAGTARVEEQSSARIHRLGR